MDQPLKARLIGATLLVILAVLLIPELLSGRRVGSSSAPDAATNDKRTFTIDIGKSGGTMTAPAVAQPQPTPSPTMTVTPGSVAPEAGRSSSAGAGDVADARGPGADAAAMNRSAPDSAAQVPATVGQGAAATSSTASPAVGPPAAKPAVPPATASRGGDYFVQVGAFSSGDAARRLMARLEADGYSTQVAPTTRGGKTLHRVRVGPVASRAEAQQLAERLKAHGLPASLVTSD